MRSQKAKRSSGEGGLSQRKQDGLWVGSYYHNGRRRVVYGKTRAVAARKLREAQSLARKDRLPDPGRLTMGEWFARWLKTVKQARSEQTYEAYETAWRKHISQHLADVPAASLRSHHLHRLLDHMIDRGMTATRIEDVFKVVRAAVHAGRQESPPIMAHNPLKKFGKARKGKGHSVLPLIEKIKFVLPCPDRIATLRRLARESNTTAHALIELAIGAGLRSGEARALAWRHVDFGARTITVERQVIEAKGNLRFGSPKSEKSARTVPMPQFVADAILAHRDATLGNLRRSDHADQIIFRSPRNGGLLSRSYHHRRYWHPYRSAADLPTFRYHHLRHVYATHVLMAGIDPKTLQELLGHESSLFSMEVYAHVSSQRKVKTADVLQESLGLAGQ